MAIVTMVGAGGGGPLNVGEGCFGPSGKRQPKGPSHSIGGMQVNTARSF
jgi:hypothetical protein